MREKSGSIACSEQEQSGNEATAPGGDVTADRAGIKNTFKNGELVRIYNENGDFLALGKIYDDNLIKLEVTFFDN